MKIACYSIIALMVSAGCARQPTLPADSRFNTTAFLGNSAWYGTGRVLRLMKRDQELEEVRQFNLLIDTDIDYPGMPEGRNPNTSNGCVDTTCTRTQVLLIYNIPLKKGRTRISKLDKRSTMKHEYAQFTYLGNSGGVIKQYIYKRDKPGWIRVTKFDRASGTVEGRFAISFAENEEIRSLRGKGFPETARFDRGLFRIKITDVILR